MRFTRVWASLAALGMAALSGFGEAQHPAARLAGSLSNGERQVLAHSRPPRASDAHDLGALAQGTQIQGITLVFNRSTAQEQDLQGLLAAQQDPKSPQFHQWLTPETFGARFGVADADLAKAENWLQEQGFTIGRITRAHDRVSFSGTAAQVNAAFKTELHRYAGEGSRVDFAPSTDLSLPAGLAPIVTAVTHLSTFRPKPMVRRIPSGARSNYTTSGSQEHFLTPGDVATMYDVTSLYNSGFTGAGQTIAIAGETYIDTADVANFQSASGLPANLPSLVLEPGTGASAIFDGDEFESDLDLEYSTGMAPGANVLFVYVGDSPNYDAFDAFDYIVEENLAPVASVSYGSCEPLTGGSYVQQGNQLFEQGAAQGQTLITSAGDTGSTNCFGTSDGNGNAEPAAVQEGLAISYPADSPYVTAIGGTQMAPGTFAAGSSQYWTSAGSTSIADSLLSYVPEVVWNETSSVYGIAGGGGGASIYLAAPTWQTGVPGIPAGTTKRLMPDISLQASITSPGYLACTSDTSAYVQGQTSSCAKGLYDSTGKFITEAGGTSFGAPIFAGLMAVLNQHQHGSGQGNVNSTLWALASNSAIYASAFHDITSGNNGCVNYPSGCTAGTTYTAGTGFDEATGLGSIDFAKLVAAWPASATSALAGTTVTLSPATLTPASGASDVIGIAIGSSGTGSVPTGTVTISLASNQAPVTGGLSTVPAATKAATLNLTNGQVSYTFPGTAVAGTQVVTVSYSGDATHASSTASVGLTVANTLVPSGSFTFTVGALTVPANSYGTANIVVTPANGYNGAINFALPSLPSADCFATGYSAVSGVTTIEIAVGNGTECSTGAAVRVGSQVLTFPKRAVLSSSVPAKPAPGSRRPLLSVFAGVLAVGLLRRRKKLNTAFLVVTLALLGTASLGLTGCGGSSTSSIPRGGTGSNPTGTTLNLTLQGTDTITSSISATAPFTVTVP